VSVRIRPRALPRHRSSVVELSIRNRAVVGSNPTGGSLLRAAHAAAGRSPLHTTPISQFEALQNSRPFKGGTKGIPGHGMLFPVFSAGMPLGWSTFSSAWGCGEENRGQLVQPGAGCCCVAAAYAAAVIQRTCPQELSPYFRGAFPSPGRPPQEIARCRSRLASTGSRTPGASCGVVEASRTVGRRETGGQASAAWVWFL
jgi:hypothetical protein